jgi:hypothetical protein
MGLFGWRQNSDVAAVLTADEINIAKIIFGQSIKNVEINLIEK